MGFAERARGMDVDFGRTAGDYARHRAGFPDSLFERLAAFGIGRAGQRVVDLGTGTGALGRGFARRGCVVTGVDVSAPLLAEARGLDAEGSPSSAARRRDHPGGAARLTRSARRGRRARAPARVKAFRPW